MILGVMRRGLHLPGVLTIMERRIYFEPVNVLVRYFSVFAWFITNVVIVSSQVKRIREGLRKKRLDYVDVETVENVQGNVVFQNQILHVNCIPLSFQTV